MTEQDTGQRRRASDFHLHPDPIEELYPGQDRRRRDRRDRRRQRRTTARSFLRKFRQPIIGLSMVGVAAPLTLATRTDSPQAEEAQPTEADLARAQANRHLDAEDQVAGKIAAETQISEQDTVVQTAVEKYGIDKKLAKDIYDVAEKEGINPRLAYGLVHTESSFQPRAKSGVGARGLTQVMPRTARWLVPGTKPDDLWQERTNLTLGFRYLNQLIDKYHGNVHKALTAYNRGPGTVDRILKRGGNPDNGYAGKVLGSGLGDRS